MDIIDALDELYVMAGEAGMWRAAVSDDALPGWFIDDRRTRLAAAVGVLLSTTLDEPEDLSSIDHNLTQPL